MNPEDIARILDDLGNRIGPAGEYVWQLTVRQVVIDAWLWGAFGILLFLVGVACVVIAVKMYPPDSGDTPISDGAAFLALTGLAASIAGILMDVMLGTTLLNPEYHAMIRLLDSVLP